MIKRPDDSMIQFKGKVGIRERSGQKNRG